MTARSFGFGSSAGHARTRLVTMTRRIPFALGLLLSFAFVLACARSTPRTRVAADLGCTPSETKVKRIEDREARPNTGRWQVTGCGKTAVYLCTEPVRDCWREGEIEVAPAAP